MSVINQVNKHPMPKNTQQRYQLQSMTTVPPISAIAINAPLTIFMTCKQPANCAVQGHW